MKFRTRPWAALVAALMIAGCTTPYSPDSRGSGFQEQQLSQNVYRIAFGGNGNTGEDQVVVYWLYRCAELTVRNGYSYFGMLPEPGAIGMFDSEVPAQLAGWHGDDSPRMMKTKGGGGFVYIPSYSTYTVRTWHKRGTIAMFATRTGATTPAQAYSLHAQTILDRFGAYVKNDVKNKAPDIKQVIDAAAAFGPHDLPGPTMMLPESTTVIPTL